MGGSFFCPPQEREVRGSCPPQAKSETTPLILITYPSASIVEIAVKKYSLSKCRSSTNSRIVFKLCVPTTHKFTVIFVHYSAVGSSNKKTCCKNSRASCYLLVTLIKTSYQRKHYLYLLKEPLPLVDNLSLNGPRRDFRPQWTFNKS